jgi:type IV secretion system protein VirB9
MVGRFVNALCLVLLAAGAVRAQNTRDVTVSDRSVVQVHTKVRFTTLIILPEHEQILDYVCGDKEFWVVSGADNLAYVKPAKAGAETNLNLVTASGTVYSFLLTESTAPPDLKLYVVADDGLASAVGERKYYTAADVDSLRRSADDAKKAADEATTTATKQAEERIHAFRASYPISLQFPYRFEAEKPPFHVAAIYTDGTFTFIHAHTTELPALYEVRDGAPNLVNFQVEQGVYVVPKVLERGYLAIGKHRLLFESKR